MAVTLTDSGELTYASFGIEKMETDENGDIVVFGKCSDGEVDSDNQVVSPSSMASASKQWMATGANLRVQHNPQRDPAGVGLEVNTDREGGTWLKGLVVEPIAKRLVAKGALRAFSVGIARPTIERDVTGKAHGGRITDGELVEVSLVDRPANARCRFQLAKSENGIAEYTGTMFGNDADIRKALKADAADEKVNEALGRARDAVDEAMRMQSQDPDNLTDPNDVKVWSHLEDAQGILTEAQRDQNMDVDKGIADDAEDMTLTFTPTDLAKILHSKVVERHYDDLALKAIGDSEDEVLGKDHREFSEAERRRHAKAGNALADGSYPIPDKDALRRAAILARSKHGNWQAASRLIARRAKELGVPNPMTETSSSKGEGVTDAPDQEIVKDYDKDGTLPGGTDVAKNETGEPEAVKAEEPVVTKDPADGPKSGKPRKPKGSGKAKKLPPWLQGKADSPAAEGKDDEAGGDDDGDDDETCKLRHTHTDKCVPSGTPQSASGAKDAAPMSEMPSPGAYQHTPMPAGRATADHKGVGASPETAALLRFKSIGIDPDLGRLHDLTCSAYHPDEVAAYHPFANLKNAVDTGLWQRKAVDAACGPIESALVMTRIWQAAETLKSADMADLNDYRLELHKAFRDANPGPTTYPTPGMLTPGKFNRPCITEGHAANSPEYGSPNASAQVATSAPSAHSFDRPPLTAGHQSPSPSFMKGDFEYPSETGVPQRLDYARIDKEKARMALAMMHDHLAHAFPLSCPMIEQNAYRTENATTPPPTAGVSKSDSPVIAAPGAVFKAPMEKVDENVYKAFKKMRKKLGKKVLSGKMTIDEARSKLGRNFTQKAAEPEVAKAAPAAQAAQEPIARGADADVIKSAVSEAVAPLMELLTKANSRIDEQQATLDHLADQPDPRSAAFTGLALNPVRKNARPAGALSQAEIAERTQQMIMRQLTQTWRASDNPAEREAARTALDKYQGII